MRHAPFGKISRQADAIDVRNRYRSRYPGVSRFWGLLLYGQAGSDLCGELIVGVGKAAFQGLRWSVTPVVAKCAVSEGLLRERGC